MLLSNLIPEFSSARQKHDVWTGPNFSGPKSNIQIEIRLMNFVLLLVSLRDRLLSLQNDDTLFLLEMYSWFCSFF